MHYLRIDDIGASSKVFEYYGKNSINIFGKVRRIPERLSNFLFLKEIPLWKGWAKYRELNFNDWIDLINYLISNKLVLNVAVTACWVDQFGELCLFSDMFPEQVEIINYGIKNNVIYILNHGLTHCIPGLHKPLLFKSNQKYHREFTKYLSLEKQYFHLRESQEILKKIFKVTPKILVPPGNNFNVDTLRAMQRLKMRYIQCHRDTTHQPSDMELLEYGIIHIDNSFVQVLHDKDIVVSGLHYLESIKNNSVNSNFDSMDGLIEAYE